MSDEARGLVLGCLLGALAGAVDAIGFIRLGHLFVAFMGGNTTTLSVAAAQGHWSEAGQGGELVGFFLAGAVIGGATEAATGRWHLPAVLLLVAALLAIAGAAVAPIALLTLAMGALNATLHRAGSVPFGITYVTGVLGRFGEGLGRWAADLAAGRTPSLKWIGQGVLWIGLVAGVAGGTGIVAALGPQAPLVPAGAALALAALAPILLPRMPPGRG